MLKRTLLLLTVICTGFVLFTTTAISLERSHEKVITSEELQKMAGLRNKIIESNFIEGQKSLTKIPSMLDATVSGLKQYKQSLAQKNKLMEKIQLQSKVDATVSGLKQYKQSLAQKNKLMGKIQLQSKVDEVRPVRLPSQGNADRDCSDCEFDFTPYGSECCDSAWDEYGINCADLEGNYNWDCSGCACPGDTPGECGDGACNSNEDCESCEADCGVCGECDDGYIADCADDDCCPESWIGDGFADCEDQAYGCDLTCYDNDGGD